MKKTFLAMTLMCLPWLGMAAPKNDMTDLYFAGKDAKLTAQEKAAVNMSQAWKSGASTGVEPTMGPDGAVRFLLGAQQPSVVCAVLQVCDVELQAGELVNSIHLGDQARWVIEPAVTGNGPAEVQHLIIKPLDVNLQTSLIVTTNRRTYHLRLRSHRTDTMVRVGFTYPEEALAKWDAIRTRETKQKQEQTIPTTNEYLGDLNFNYEVSGSAAWKPVRVYSDGVKTILQMPKAMSQTEAPSLLVVRKEGGVFSDDENVMVNYRVQGDRFIVDSVFDKAILIAGVGSSQDRITVTKLSKEK